MPFEYSDASRALQDRFYTRRLADRLSEVRVHDQFTDADRAFIEARDSFFLATVDERGQPTCSYKGGDPGFVTVLDRTTLAFPNYDGNGMYRSMGNVSGSGRVGLLFLDLERQSRVRVEGVAELAFDHALMQRHPECQFIVLVRAEAIFPNCPRYIHRYQLMERSRFVPRSGAATPTPDWKRSEWARDVLPAGDPAAGGTADSP
ncbi:MAG: pyridoxamine 5'-phosphate oxidase family protein [Gemmatimonadetes bacterium]|nr:pyridoxamine 5'-phosphate oxidase family protein [Gemmatimonadota bacterium]